MRGEWGVGDDCKLVGEIARFDRIKNHLLFLKAAARVVQRSLRFSYFTRAIIR